MDEKRPRLIIELFWREVTVIEEKAEILEPIYLEAA